MNQILKRQTSRFHYGSKVPAVSDCCLAPTDQLLSYIMARASCIWMRYGRMMSSFHNCACWSYSWIFISLSHWNNSPLVDMLLHSVTLSWFWNNNPLVDMLLHSVTLSWLWNNKSLFLLYDAVYLVVNSKYQFYTNGVSSDHAQGEVHLVPHYVIKFASDLRQVSGLSPVLRFTPPIKLIAPRYIWNSIDSGVKHHNLHPNYIIIGKSHPPLH